MNEMTDIAARLDRIERLLHMLMPVRADPVERDLVAALGALTGRDWFTASETFAAIEALRRACEVTGDPAPFVAQALANLGISSARSLGRWLAGLPPEAIERSTKTNAGMLGPPPLKWSAVMIRKRRIENGQQATEAGRDCLEVAAG